MYIQSFIYWIFALRLNELLTGEPLWCRYSWRRESSLYTRETAGLFDKVLAREWGKQRDSPSCPFLFCYLSIPVGCLHHSWYTTLPWRGLLLLLLSHFSHVQLCVTPIDGSPPGSPVPGILQARTLEWVAISFSNAWKWKVKSESEVAKLCPTLSDPMDCSLPGSSVHGIFQARVLEWVAIAFSHRHL